MVVVYYPAIPPRSFAHGAVKLYYNLKLRVLLLTYITFGDMLKWLYMSKALVNAEHHIEHIDRNSIQIACSRHIHQYM